MFDRSLLPDRKFEFVVVSDTHYMLPEDDVEFESRRQQTTRAERALDCIDSLDPEFVVHLGDLVQEFPGREQFDKAMDAATDQLSRVSAPWHHVAGNHDVGDKPDPLMPTDWVSEQSLDAYHARFGRSWYTWTIHGRRFVVINSQILNSSLEAADNQCEWLETVLEDSEEPVMLFLHLPPFLDHEGESGLGHYDNVDQPARTWLVDLVRSSPVTHVFAGHSHFEFRTTLGGAVFQTVPSVSFTRPGFAELFSSPPPAEQGRNDRDKLGFYLVRVDSDNTDLHRILTHGETESVVGSDARRFVSGTTKTLSGLQVGASLLTPLVERTSIPAAFPSSIPQSVRNDYPLVSCLQAGVGAVRVPLEETTTEGHRAALDVLRRNGAVVVTSLFPRNISALDERGMVGDELEFRVPSGPLPTRTALQRIGAARGSRDIPVTLSTTVPNRVVDGKQHDRLRTGYAVEELAALVDHLATHDCQVDRVLCQVPGSAEPWDVIPDAPDGSSLGQIGAVDFLVNLHGLDSETHLRRIAESVFAAGSRRKSRIYLEPLRSLDRTMDVAHGLLDRCCNPTAGFRAVRCLNTALFETPTDWSPSTPASGSEVSIRGLNGGDRHLWLVLPDPEVSSSDVQLSPETTPEGTTGITTYSFQDGRVVVKTRQCSGETGVTIHGVTLVAFR